jgi:hypothetical protein
MSKWVDFAMLSFEEADAAVSGFGFTIHGVHRAMVDNDWMAVAHSRKGAVVSARGRNPHEAVCRLAWELTIRQANQQGSTGRK